MSKKKILITGGAGYIGSLLAPALLKHGYDVRIFDNLIFGDEGIATLYNQIEFIGGDIMQPPQDLMEGVYGVIHLAGVSSQAKASYRSPRYTDLMNHIGTEIIGVMAKASKVKRFILASSCSIYCSYKHTPISEAPFFNEEDHVDIFNPYSLSKRAAEEALFELMDADFQPTMLRKGTVYGFAPKMRYDLVINAFTKDAFRQKKIQVNAGGEIYRPFIDIRDVIEAYIAALELPLEKVGGQIFNLVDDNHKIGDLALRFKRIIKKEKDIDIELDIRPFEVMLNYKADNKKFKEVFQFKPSRTLEDAIMETWGKLESGHDHTNLRFYNDPWYAEAYKQGLLTTKR